MADKRTRMRVIFRDDHIGMLRAVFVYMADCLGQIVNDTNSQYGPQILLTPICLGRRMHGHRLLRTLAASKLDTRVLQLGGQGWQHCFDNIRVDQQCFQGVAYRQFFNLGVKGNSDGHLRVGLSIDVHVANAIEMFDDGYARLAADTLNQALATPRNDHINIVMQL